MLTHRFPYPPNRGDRIRTYNLLRTLASHFRVTLACTSDEAVSEAQLAHVRPLCEDLCVVELGSLGRLGSAAKSFFWGRSLTEGMFASSALWRRIQSWQHENAFDAVLVVCSSMFPYVDNPAFSSCKTVVDLIDVDSQKWSELSRTSNPIKRWIYRWEANRILNLERRIAHAADAVTLVSDHEAQLFRDTIDIRVPTHGIANGVDTEYFQPCQADSTIQRESCSDGHDRPTANAASAFTQLVFTGVLNYAPNVDGIAWFCRKVLPRLRQRMDVRLNIVGRRPNDVVSSLDKLEGVNVVGEVPDVRPYLKEAEIVISPLLIARGIQNKVLEAMAAGKAVVASPQAAEGIDATIGSHLFVAEQEDDWSKTIEQLADDQQLRKRLGQAARELVLQKYQWSARLQPLIDVIQSETAR